MTSGLSELIHHVESERGAPASRAAARLMTLLENDPACRAELLAQRQGEFPRPAWVVGITGPPGSGKSTLVDSLLAHARAEDPQALLGVLAVDPSSPFTGGAVLGDRVRMMRHALDEQTFIRSLATRGHLGGLSAAAESVLAVFGLMGADTVFIETVGVGQNEIEVATLADVTCVVLAPGLGDGVQLLKAGLMEIGDLFVVNKADRDDAELLFRQLESSLEQRRALAGLARAAGQGGSASAGPVAVLVSATEGQGTDALWKQLREFRSASTP